AHHGAQAFSLAAFAFQMYSSDWERLRAFHSMLARDCPMSAACRRLTCFASAAFLLLPVVALSQSSDRLTQIKQLSRVAAQKAEADIRAAVKEAVPLIKTDPDGALEILEAALHTAENDPALEDAQRGSLKRLITPHLRDAKTAAGKSDKDDAESSPRKERATPQRRDDEGAQRIKDVRDRIDRTRDQLREKREVRG